MSSKKVVLLTGGCGAVGTALAISFAREGAVIAVAEKNENKLKRLTSLSNKMGIKLLPIFADYTEETKVHVIIETTISTYGKIDVLVVNPTDVFQDTIEHVTKNLKSVVDVTRLAIPHLKKSKGTIVHIVHAPAINDNVADPNVYSSYASAMERFTKESARMLSPFSINVNLVNPGSVYSEIVGKSDIAGCSTSKVSFGELVDADEVADFIVEITRR